MPHPAPLALSALALLLLSWSLATTAEQELPKIVQEQLAVVQPALAKAQADYAKKVQDENAKLVAVIQKAMEKATRAGKLDDALALKSALEQARSGELIKPYVEPSTTDLLGNAPGSGAGAGAGADGLAVVTLSTGDPVDTLAPNKAIYNNRDYLISEVSKELLGLSYAKRSFKEPAPCTIKVVAGGVLYVAVGVPVEGLDFAGLGFVPTELAVACATDRLAVVKKIVRTGETITLAPSAKTSSFPIWKAAK
jgi:hypothetical protein